MGAEDAGRDLARLTHSTARCRVAPRTSAGVVPSAGVGAGGWARRVQKLGGEAGAPAVVARAEAQRNDPDPSLCLPASTAGVPVPAPPTRGQWGAHFLPRHQDVSVDLGKRAVMLGSFKLTLKSGDGFAPAHAPAQRFAASQSLVSSDCSLPGVQRAVALSYSTSQHLTSQFGLSVSDIPSVAEGRDPGAGRGLRPGERPPASGSGCLRIGSSEVAAHDPGPPGRWATGLLCTRASVCTCVCALGRRFKVLVLLRALEVTLGARAVRGSR